MLPKAQTYTLGTDHQKSDKGGGEPKKIHARENDGKIHAKKKLKEKNYAEGSSNCDFY